MKIKDEKQPKDTLEKLDGIHAHAEYENTHIHWSTAMFSAQFSVCTTVNYTRPRHTQYTYMVCFLSPPGDSSSIERKCSESTAWCCMLPDCSLMLGNSVCQLIATSVLLHRKFARPFSHVMQIMSTRTSCRNATRPARHLRLPSPNTPTKFTFITVNEMWHKWWKMRYDFNCLWLCEIVSECKGGTLSFLLFFFFSLFCSLAWRQPPTHTHTHICLPELRVAVTWHLIIILAVKLIIK